VRIPLGFLSLYGIVSKVGAAEATEEAPDERAIVSNRRWIEVQLVGESYRNGGFQRGVSIFPTLDDEVHMVCEDDLATIYACAGGAMAEIGTHAASESLRATIDLDRLVTRHAAIIGSTGSGKSNTVAGILRALTDGRFPGSRVVVMDPHGEYGTALRDRARVFSIGNDISPLVVPYWALSFDELAWFLVDRRTASETLQDSVMRDYVFEQRQKNCSSLAAGPLDPGEITVDSPVPFSVRELWYHFDRKERVTYEDMPRSREALEAEGDPAALKPARFRPPGPGSSAPFKPTQYQPMGSYVNRILGRLKDKRFSFLMDPGSYDGVNRDLHDLIAAWVDHEQPITILDLGGVPFEVIDLVVGVLTRILFENMFWGRDTAGNGRQRPLLVVYEEAHAYLPRGASGQFLAGYAGRAVRRVFKEGRKLGLGAIVVSQRPSELDETILAQCGTVFALRLSNAEDHSRVRAIVPDALAGILDLLPALRTGEALILGEAVPIPSRVRLPLIEPRPRSDDPETAEAWKKPRVPGTDYSRCVTSWRRQGK
jgi:hypothetical protein